MSGRKYETGLVQLLALFAGFLCFSALPEELAGQAIPELATVRAIRALTPLQAAEARPVHLRGMVTAVSPYKSSFFMVDATGSIFVNSTLDGVRVQPGMKVEIHGVTDSGQFRPVVFLHDVKSVGQERLPAPHLFNWDELAGGILDSQWIAVRGVVRSAAIETRWARPVLVLKVEIGPNYLLLACVSDYSAGGWDRLPGSTVEISGVAGSVFNDKKQFLGPKLFVSNLGDVAVERLAPTDPFDVPMRSVETLLQSGDASRTTRRVKVQGIVTYFLPGESLFIQDGMSGVLARVRQTTPLALGTKLEVAGYPVPGRYSPVLEDAVYRVVGQTQPVAALPAPAAGMVVINQYGFSVAPFDGLVVETRGRLLEYVADSAEDRLILREGSRTFTARLPRSGPVHPVLAAGSVLRLTGVCVALVDGAHLEEHEARSFALLLRSPADIVVVEKAPWWNAARAGWMVALSLMVIFAAVAILLVVRWNAATRALAMTDPLTGLLNRRGFFLLAEHRWQLALRNKTSMLLFYIDLDQFKQINDLLGHKAGDQALRDFALVLRECFRSTDIIARMGGDEFAVITENSSPEFPAAVDLRLANIVAQKNKEPGRTYQLSSSVGALCCDASLKSLSLDELLAKADDLMYLQKEEKRREA